MTIAATLSALSLTACGALNPTTYRYRMVVNVEAAGRTISGSSIVEISTWRGSGIPDNALRERVRGEAAAVKLPSGAVVLVLLNDANYSRIGARLALRAYAPSFTDLRDEFDPFVRLARLKNHSEIVELPKEGYPMIIKLERPQDPGSAVLVDPTNIETYRGHRVFIRSITIQITRENLEYSISRQFIWWRDYKGKHLDGSTSRYTDMQSKDFRSHIGPQSFSTEYHR